MEADLQAVIDEWSPIIAEKEPAHENAETDEESAAEEASVRLVPPRSRRSRTWSLEYALPIEAIEEQLEAISLERDAGSPQPSDRRVLRGDRGPRRADSPPGGRPRSAALADPAPAPDTAFRAVRRVDP